MRRPQKIFALRKDKDEKRNSGRKREDDASGYEKTKPIAQVVEGPNEELAYVTILDIGRNLPVVLSYRSEGINDHDQQIIRNHLSNGIARYSTARPGIDSPPQCDDCE